MPRVEALKCPNCGGAVRGSGVVTCPYCGSELEVARRDAEQLRAVKREFGTVGVDMGVKPPFIFKNLPGVEVTRETKEIPFQPEVIFARLPGGEPTETLREEAEAVLDVIRRTQEAINREDMDAYMTSITSADEKFRAKAREGAKAQFVSSDMKRFTASADFRQLTAQLAEVIVTIEAFIFLNSGQVNHLQVPFYWKVRKEAGRWVVYASRVGGAAGKISRPACLIPIIGLAVGLIAAVFAVISECREENRVNEPAGEEVAVWAADSHKKPMPDTWFKAKTAITLYESPREGSDIEGILKPGGEFQVMSESQGWYHVRAKPHFFGWVPEDVLKKQLGEDYDLVRR